MSEYADRELGWDDAIEHDSEGFEVVPEGDYSFKVTNFQRARHPGSDKLPPCNKAILTLAITDGTHSTTLTHNLVLHSKTEGLLCAFFTAIGQRKHGERLSPKWDQVIGATGTCKVGVREWTGREGDKRKSNQIERFYERPDTPAPAAASYSAGKF